MKIVEQMQRSELFTDSEQKIIKYFIEHLNSIEKISINELASNTFSSNATIIRLCKKLGYTGYREFKLAFIREIESDKYVVKNVDYSNPFQPEESTASIVNSIYSLYREGMDMMQSQLDVNTLDHIVKQMVKAKRIFLFGISDVNITLKGFINKLVKIGIFPVLATDNVEEGHICPSITKDDCALFVSYSGKHKSYQYCVKILKRNHVPIMLLTANKNSPIYDYCDYKICIPDQEKKENIATFYSQLVFEYLLNLIYSLIYRELERTKKK